MKNYIKRILEDRVLEYLKYFSVVSVTGPRQSGKSTMLKELLGKTYKYVTFDDFQIRELFYEDPKLFMINNCNYVIFDEAQKVPELFEMVKMIVDKNPQKKGQIVLTGSSQFHLMHKISESLAGRVGILELLPFQYAEVVNLQKNEKAIYKGGYPELLLRNYKFDKEWYSSYLDTYINKDVKKISNIGNIRDFRRFLTLLAANSAQNLNISRFANDLGVATGTIKHWISILEASYIIFLLEPYYNNLGKRVVKSPKVYFYDTGLVSYLTGIATEDMYNNGPMSGAIFENYLISEILKSLMHSRLDEKLFYYRTSNGVEMDLIIDYKTHCDFIEIKKNFTFKGKMLQNLKKFSDDKNRGLLLYQGENMDYSTTIRIKNYKTYLLNIIDVMREERELVL